MSVLGGVLTVSGLVSGTGPPAAAAAGGASTGTICYNAHVQDLGWLDWKCAGQMAGTQGQGLNLEALNFMTTIPGGICARVKLVGARRWDSWECRNVNESFRVGTVGENQPLEQVEIKIRDIDATDARLIGSAHVRNRGWLGDGNAWRRIYLGSEGWGLPMEAIRIFVV
ncbi:hypothetical protein ACFWYW_55135 [Nonomuraea sp. NPDC059023]|uniref:hypothetical protein n=1 Tax=unclassified Nonomuraea TaxID=2593643 RepID=UPI0036A0B90B